MAYRMKSSGLPFKELGSSPAKQKGMTGLTEEERKMKRAKLSSDVKSFVTGKKVDPYAPGTPGEPGYEPPVRREDLDAEGKKLYDSKRNAKKHPLGIEDPAELEKLYKTTEKPRQ